MTPANEHELASSMMLLWGKCAGRLARNYALECWCRGDMSGCDKWHSVEQIVERARAAMRRSERIADYIQQPHSQPTPSRPLV